MHEQYFTSDGELTYVLSYTKITNYLLLTIYKIQSITLQENKSFFCFVFLLCISLKEHLEIKTFIAERVQCGNLSAATPVMSCKKRQKSSNTYKSIKNDV